MEGEIKDGYLFETATSGMAKVVDYINSEKIIVEFIDTGHQTKVKKESIQRGYVKDRTKRSVFGVGYIGEGVHKSSCNGSATDAYRAWSRMLERCYSETALERFPTYRGVTVCDEWHNFQNFAEWMINQDYKGKSLDKDCLGRDLRVYSPDTCKFISMADNVKEAHAKKYEMLSPSGELVEIYNMLEFCRRNNLNQGNMSEVYHGNKKSYKGWTNPNIEWGKKNG